MYSYCHACKKDVLRQLIECDKKWSFADLEASGDICYLWDDFTVRSEPVSGKTVLFASRSPQWIQFCSDTFFLDSAHQDQHTSAFHFQYSDSWVRLSNDRETGFLPLTSGQWWYSEELKASHSRYFDMSFSFFLKEDFHVFSLEKAIHYLMEHHDTLRLRLLERDGILCQAISDTGTSIPLSLICMPDLSEIEQEKIIEIASYEMHKRINQFDGPLFHVACFDFGRQKPRYVLWIISHFIMDAFSIQILQRDLHLIIEQIIQGKEIRLPARTTSFAQWTRKIEEYLHSPDAEKEFHDYWLTLPWDQVKPFPSDMPADISLDLRSSHHSYGTEGSTREIIVSLDDNLTRMLLTQTLDANTTIMHLFLTAMAQTFKQWIGSPVLYLFVVNHGRQTIFRDIDLTRTTGYIAQVAYLFLNIDGASTQEEILQAVRKQVSFTPNQGRTLEWLLRKRDNSPILELLRNIPWPELNFNFVGKLDQSDSGVLRFQKHIKLMSSDPAALRNHSLDFMGTIYNNRLFTRWQYSEAIHQQRTIKNLAENFIGYLQDVILYRQSVRYTHVFYPSTGLS